jgi:hypothetical protein
MRVYELFERDTTWSSDWTDARPFGIWLGRLYDAKYHKVAGIYLYDYNDDSKHKALRYRLMVDKEFLSFVHDVMPQINANGWHLTAQTKAARNRWQLVFEPTLTSRVPKSTIVWHLTHADNVASILRDGLIPSQSRHGFKYPQKRTYFLKNQSDVTTMMHSFAERDKTPVAYTALKVDLRKAVNVRLHIDPELADVAVFTTDPVPPRAISA